MTRMFVGREKELVSLKEFYEKDGIGMTVIYGRRRIGKSTLITEFIKDKNGNVCQAKLTKLKSEKDPKTGRMMMVPVEGSEEVIPVDVVLIAAGFLGSEKYVTDAFKVAINGRTNVDTKPEQYQTSVDKVFTAGDMHRGQSLVVWAIREGREAAKAVDESLMGYSYL